MMRRSSLQSLIGVFVAACVALPAWAGPNVLTEAQTATGWRLLFDGQTLHGWTATGNMNQWKAKGGMIIAGPEGGGGWLRTVDQYRDFELLVDFRVTPGGNSGLAIRASATNDPAFTGMELQIYDSHGQEPTRTNTGAVYDAIAPLSMAVKKPGEWNTYRVLLVDDVLNVWLNDQQIHLNESLDERGFRHRQENPAPLDRRVKSGYIALQDYGREIAFRNLKIRPIKVHPLDEAPAPGEPAWVDLFNGHNLEGWFAKGGTDWTVENGELIGRNGPGHLYTTGIYKDFELRAKVRVITKGNSGFYFRARPPAKNPDSWPDGYEAQVDHRDPKNFTGCIYGRAWAKELVTRENDWFDYAIRAVGNQITVAINGHTVLETELSVFADGHVALQGHHPGNEIRWRDIQIRTLDDSPSKKKEARRGRNDNDAPVNLFYCTHSASYEHAVLPESREIIERLGEQHDWLNVTVSNDIADLTPELMKNLDVIMFYTTGELPMTEEQKWGFQRFCNNGGAFVGVHSATDTFYEWPWYVNHIGGSFNGHPWHEDVGVLVVDLEHPATRGFLFSRFEIMDEIYMFKNESDDRHVLLELDPSTTPDKAAGHFPKVSWTKTTGKGRMFYTSLGHRSDVWNDSRFITHLLGGVRWAAGVED